MEIISNLYTSTTGINIMTRCHTDIAQDQYDRVTALSDQAAKEIESFEQQAFNTVLADTHLMDDVIADLTPFIIQCISDSNDCYPRQKGAVLEDMISNASAFQSFVDKIRDKVQDDIEEEAVKLWRNSI